MIELKRVFSGVQPTGNIHIGNYLGALKQFIELQEDHQCIYCIVDMHSITVPQDPQKLREHILDVAALYLAIGVDPKKSIVFVQSDVPGHSELSWILTCNAYTGELSRMTQFKDKAKGRESAPAGLFTYPVLMAADILLYDTDVVPVGVDQKQHIELCRDIAGRINNKFEGTFVMPEGRFLKSGARIMSLDNPENKMSKSAENIHSRISLLDDEKKIKKSVMRATTDSDACVKFNIAEKAGISNLMNIYSAFSGVSIADIEEKFKGAGYGEFKKDLAEKIVKSLMPIQEKYEKIRYSSELKDILHEGSKEANSISCRTIARVKEKFGLGI